VFVCLSQCGSVCLTLRSVFLFLEVGVSLSMCVTLKLLRSQLPAFVIYYLCVSVVT